MEEKVAYVVQKTSEGFEKIKVDKSFQELSKSKDTLSKICFEKRTPDGKILEPCIFHSYSAPKDIGNEKMYNFCLEGIKDFAVCTENYQVFDLCYLEERKNKERTQKYFLSVLEKANKYDHNMSVTYKMHEEFMVNVEKRRQLLAKKLELEKIHGTELNLESYPEYMVLLQILQKAEENLENVKKNLEKIYMLKEYTVSKEEFTSNLMKTEIDKVEKAKANLNTWSNKHKKTNNSQGQELILKVKLQIDSINEILNASFENPLVYVYKAIKALEDLEYYYRSVIGEEKFYMRITEDLQICKRHFLVYKEFLANKDIESVIFKVEKEQREAAEEEKRIKQSSYIRTAKSSGNRGIIVKLDGSVVQDNSNQPKLIIGNVVEGKIEDEQWRSLRR
jgi:hypothetical protein